MPSSAARRSPRAAPPRAVVPVPAQRPHLVPFAVTFGLLVAAEVLFLGWLLWSPDPGLDWFLVVPLALAALAVTGALLVLRGRAGGWIVLAVAALLPLVALLGVVFLFGAFGASGEMWLALLLAIGPLGCLVLALRRPVREWTSSAARRSAGGRRQGVRAR
jgi:hypothetical protein